MLENARSKEASIVSLAMRTPDREKYLNFTTPIVSVPNVIIVQSTNKQSLRFKDFAGKKLVVPAGYAVQEYLQRIYPEIQLIPAESTYEGLKKVSFGEFDAMVADLGQVTYFVKKHGITNLRVSSETEYELNLSFAVRKDWPELLNILNKTLSSIDKKTKEDIFNKWINLEYIPFWQSSQFWQRSIFLLMVIFLPVFLIFLWNMSLRQKVLIQTNQLRNQLNLRKKAEKALQKHKQELEVTVLKRTRQLEEKNRQLEQARQRLEALTVTDVLTGLKNRRYLFQTINEGVARIKRQLRSNSEEGVDSSACGLSFFMIDIDYFKNINDQYGHESGDIVLKGISHILKEVCRESDIVVRWGGEEFLVSAQTEERKQLELIAERIRSSVESATFNLKKGNTIQCTCSIGFATFPFVTQYPNEVDWEEVVNFADQALYMAKVQGRNGWVGVSATVFATPEKINDNINDLSSLISAGAVSANSSFQEPPQFGGVHKL